METSVIADEKVIKETTEEKKSSWVSWLGFIAVLAVAFFIFRFALGFIVIAGDSMNPTLEDGNMIVSSNIFYNVDRSDIIVYHDELGFDAVKRVIGIPNDRVAITDGLVFVNGEAITETYMTGIPNDMAEVTVPENSYFVIGDNRTPGESLDSRSAKVGPISREYIKGEVIFSIFPISKPK